MKTIFFCEYPKKEKDINKTSMIIEFAGGIFLLVVGIFVLISKGIGLFTMSFLLVMLILSWDFFADGINMKKYMKSPSIIYDKDGDRIEDEVN